MADEILTAARLRELLHYDPETGVFTWRVRKGNRIHVGDVAGTPNGRGYLVIRVDGTLYLAHRLAWLHAHGEWPPKYIDHKDAVRDHNWIDNLRPATNSENQQNQHGARCDSTSGVRGVHWYKHRGKWLAYIEINGKRKFLGYFVAKEDAIAARQLAEAMLHPRSPIHSATVDAT